MHERFLRTASTLNLLAVLGAAPTRAADPVLPLPPEDVREIVAKLGEGVVGRALPASAITDAAVYFPLAERVATYKVTAGGNLGQVQRLGVARGKRPGGTPAWRLQLSPSLSAFIEQAASGDLLIPAISDFGEGVVIMTTPPNAFVLQGMRPGESRAFAQTVSVNYLDTPDKEDYAGSLSGTFAYVGAYEVTTPAGVFETVLLRTRCKGKVGPAHTQDTAYYFLAPGVGLVAMITQEDAEAFWVIHMDTTIGRVLLSK